MTVYRQYGDLQTIVSALLTRELLELIASARAEVAGLPTARQRLVEAAVLVVTALGAHPLFRRVLDLDPELLLPLVVDRFGSSQRAAIDLVAVQLAEGRSDGSIRPLDPVLGATVLLVTAQSFVFSARVVESAAPTPGLADEVRFLLDGYLRAA